MKTILILGCLLFVISSTYGNKLDLIVTTDGDSIACKILEVNDSEIIFNMEAFGNKNVKTTINREKIVEFKYDAIQKDLYRFKPGTSYIVGKAYQKSSNIVEKDYPVTRKTYSLEYLKNASNEELQFYRYKAMKQQKTGKTLNIVGGSILGATVITSVTFADQLEMGVVVLAFFGGIAGLGSMVVGIPMSVTGKKRVERINAILNTACNGVTFDIKPNVQYNMMTKNYQPALTVRIRF